MADTKTSDLPAASTLGGSELVAVVQSSANKRTTVAAIQAAALARANHSGTQLAATISNFDEAVQDAIGTALVDTTTLNLTYTDGANSITGDVLDTPKINGVALTGTPTSGQVPTATSGSAATWQTPSTAAPDTIDYLVGTSAAGLSNEIVVGTSPGGELGGSWASPTIDTTHSGSAHADFVAKTTLDANSVLIAITDDTPVALAMGSSSILARLASGNIVAATPSQLKTLLGIAATEVSSTATGDVAATTVQTAIAELASEKVPTSYLDTDVSLAANSDTKIATQKATKAYADQLIAAADAMVFKGVIDCSANPNYPAADRGHTYRVSVAGKIGGASGTNVEAGDLLVCLIDGTASGTQAAVGSSWTISQANIDGTVTGPASSTDGGLALYNSTSGKIIKGDGLTPSNDDVLQRKSGAWANRTMAQLSADLTLVAHLAGTESITGAKTFSSDVTMSGAKLAWGTGQVSSANVWLYNGGVGARYGFGIQSNEMQFFTPSGGHYSFNIGGDLNASGTNEGVRIDPAGAVAINKGSAADTKSVLDLVSTTKGLLPPRMTTTQRDAISSPPEGLTIYNTTTHKLNVFTTAWEAVTSL